MAQDTKVSGKTISNMARARKPGQMVVSTMVNTFKGRNMAMEFTVGMMGHATRVIGMRIKSGE